MKRSPPPSPPLKKITQTDWNQIRFANIKKIIIRKKIVKIEFHIHNRLLKGRGKSVTFALKDYDNIPFRNGNSRRRTHIH